MKKKSLLEGKVVRVFIDGGWEITGSVSHDKKDRLVLELDDRLAAGAGWRWGAVYKCAR
jgi:hypothetical protein